MSLLVLAALLASQPAAGSAPKGVFTSSDIVALGERAKKRCGYANPQELSALSKGEREKIIPCFVRATIEQSKPLFPKVIEPGATIWAVSNFEGLPIFELRFSADHPRASVPKNEFSGYDRLLSTRTCDDKWLGGLIDAGRIDGEGSVAIVYKMETEQREVLSIVAVAECLDPK